MFTIHLIYVLFAFVQPFNWHWLHMGQFTQDRENGQHVVFLDFFGALARVLDELGPKRPGEIDPYVASAVDLPLKIDNCHQLIAERVSDVFLQIWNRNVLIRNCDEMIIELVGVRARRWPSVGDLRRWSDQSDHLIWMLSHCQLLFSPSIFKYCQVLSYQVLSSSIVKYCL